MCKYIIQYHEIILIQILFRLDLQISIDILRFAIEDMNIDAYVHEVHDLPTTQSFDSSSTLESAKPGGPWSPWTSELSIAASSSRWSTDMATLQGKTKRK